MVVYFFPSSSSSKGSQASFAGKAFITLRPSSAFSGCACCFARFYKACGSRFSELLIFNGSKHSIGLPSDLART
jgi:hypothetical protein